jgi:hypothetical protein
VSDIGIDGRVLSFTFLVSLLTGVTFGLAPAVRAARVDPNSVLKEGGRGGVGSSAFGLGHGTLRKALIAVEVALSLVLLIGAGLLIRSYERISNANPGFDAHNVLSLRVSLPGFRYKTPDAVSSFYRQLDDRIRALPGVRAVGSNYQLPLSSVALAWEPIGIEGYVPKAAGNDLIIASSAYISPDYFRAMGMSLVAGRVFTDHDDKKSPEVVIIDDKLAAREPPITVYFPVEQYNIGSRYVVVRTSVDAATMANAVTKAVRELDPDLPAYDVSTMETRLHDSLARRRLSMALLVTFAGCALVLAAIGIYGVIAYWVEQRTREIGIRIALGADRSNILGLVGREMIVMVSIGLLGGLIGAFALTRLMSNMLFGIGATDRLTFGILPAVLASIALVAAYLPARRALNVDPIVAVRAE